MKIGIRREDKNEWERRAPLSPGDVERLVKEGMEVLVQPSSIRIFGDDEYRSKGGVISHDLAGCDIVLGVKEIPLDCFRKGGAYMFFSHTIKGQPHNMPMLKRMMELGCTLFDYEVFTDEQGRRTIFFGPFAGLAGMIDTFWALGKRLEYFSIKTPFSHVKQAFRYSSLEEAKAGLKQVARQIKENGLPSRISPLVLGVLGYGNVARGVMEILDLFPHRMIEPGELLELDEGDFSGAEAPILVCQFKEEHLVRPKKEGSPFDLEHYYNNPGEYEPVFSGFLGKLNIVVNAIYWDERYPRFLEARHLADLLKEGGDERLFVVADLTCDINGSFECTVMETDPGDPVYVFDPLERKANLGFSGPGFPVLAVGNLPCELARESTEFFGKSLVPYLVSLNRANLDGLFDDSGLHPHLKGGVILWKGELTPKFKYLERFLKQA